ncbi:hypothetical protein, partial [Nocardia vaccinii]|uniref:hypothetical protein n=1 Tax=Nocardia vaccinii TaxID=1822 RepID=UPI0012F4F5DB
MNANDLAPLTRATRETGPEVSAIHVNGGIWIGGEYQDLTAHIPAAHGQGFLFQPHAMPSALQNWYAKLATLIGNIWDMFGHPDSAGSPPQTMIPPQVDAVPESTGAAAQQYSSLAQQLKHDLNYFVSNENSVAGLLSEGKANITEGRNAVLNLIAGINNSMSASTDVPAMYETIDNAITSANATLTAYLNDQRQIADKVQPIADPQSSGSEASTVHVNVNNLAPLTRV